MIQEETKDETNGTNATDLHLKACAHGHVGRLDGLKAVAAAAHAVAVVVAGCTTATSLCHGGSQ